MGKESLPNVANPKLPAHHTGRTGEPKREQRQMYQISQIE